MPCRRLRATLILLLLAVATVAPARADGPPAGFKLLLDRDDMVFTFTSPDHAVKVEQYFKDGERRLHQFWTFDANHQHPFLLNPGEDEDLAGYAAEFRFSPNSQWLVRGQKLGSGTSTLLLYRRKGDRFSAATKKPLGDLAWDYFFNLPTSKNVSHRNPKDRDSMDHPQAMLLKGLEENYAWMGEHWPDSRYIVICLSFDTQGEKPPTRWIEDWRCVYDTQTGKFSVPPDFAEHNAKAFTRNP